MNHKKNHLHDGLTALRTHRLVSSLISIHGDVMYRSVPTLNNNDNWKLIDINFVDVTKFTEFHTQGRVQIKLYNESIVFLCPWTQRKGVNVWNLTISAKKELPFLDNILNKRWGRGVRSHIPLWILLYAVHVINPLGWVGCYIPSRTLIGAS